MQEEIKVKLKLKRPIQNGSELISELEFREPVAKDIRNLPAEPKTGDIMDLAARLCGQPPSVIDKLSIKDFGEVGVIIGNFMDGGQATGDKA